MVDVLEARYPDFPGLNLAYETRSGIIRHRTSYDHAPEAGIEEFLSTPQPSLETQIVNLSDEIAYNCHDIEDGLRSGFFNENDLADLKLWDQVSRLIRERHPNLDSDTFRYQCIRVLIDTLIRDLVTTTEEVLSTEGFTDPLAIMNHTTEADALLPHRAGLEAGA